MALTNKTILNPAYQIWNVGTYDDQKAAGAGLETTDESIEYNLGAIFSQLNRAFNGTVTGNNWYVDPPTPSTFENGTVRGTIDNNQDLHDLERKRVLKRRAMVGVDITIAGAGDQYVILGAGELPTTTTAAVGAVTTLGTVVAFNATFGTATLDEVAGANALQPKNLMILTDNATGDVVTRISDGRQIFGLFQYEQNVDGGTISATTPERVQVSFVVHNGANDDLILITSGDMDGITFDYAYVERHALQDLPEESFLGDGFADTGVSSATRQAAYDNQGTAAVVTISNATLDIGTGFTWEIGDALSAALMTFTEGSTGGTTTLALGSDIDVYNNNAIDVNFDNGITVDNGSDAINIGITTDQIDFTGPAVITSSSTNSVTVTTDAATLNILTTTSGNVAVTSAGAINNTTATGGTTGGEFDVTCGTGTTTGGAIDLNAGAGATNGAGGAVTADGGAGAGTGVGGGVTVTGGTAGATAGTVGGAVTVNGGLGASGGTGTGGALAFTSGLPGSTTGASGAASFGTAGGGSTSGNAGNVTIFGGDTNTGDGGDVTVTGGDVTTSGVGGLISMSAGDSAGANTGGPFTASAGTGGATGDGGALTLNGGVGGATSGAGGAIDINAGAAPTSGAGGAVTVDSGSGAGAAGAGGVITVTSGAGAGTAGGGTITVQGGAGGATGAGAPIAVTGGAGGGTSGNGGGITVTGGSVTDGVGGNWQLVGANSAGANAGNSCTMSAGDAGTSGSGGYILATAGDGGSTTGDGGYIQLTAGDSPTSGSGGLVVLRAGTGSDDEGYVNIDPNYTNDDTDEYIRLTATGTNPPNSGGTQDVRMLAGNRNPDTLVTATPGSLYMRGDSTSSALYVNTTSGTAPGTSWTLLSAAGATSLQTAYETGSTISVDSGNGIIAFSNSTDATGVLSLSSTFAGAGDALAVTMGASATGIGINVSATGSGDAVFVNNTGTGAAFTVQDGGSDVFDISAAGAITGTATSGEDITLTTAGAGAVDINAADGGVLVDASAAVVSGSVPAHFTATNTDDSAAASADVTVSAVESGGTAVTTATVNVFSRVASSTGGSTLNLQSDATNAGSSTVNISTGTSVANNVVNVATGTGITNDVNVGSADTTTTFDVVTGNTTQSNSNTGPVWTFPTKQVYTSTNVDRNGATPAAVTRTQTTFTSFENLTEGNLTINFGTGYTTNAGTNTYQVTVVSGSATTDSVTDIVNGGAAVNPVFTTVGSGTFATGAYVMITTGALEENRGIYEVVSHTGTTLTVAAAASSGSEWVKNQVTSESSISATITAVTVSVFRVDTTGNYALAEGATNAGTITYTDITTGTVTLETAWANNTGTTTTLNTNFTGQVTDNDVYLIRSETGTHTLMSLAPAAAGDAVTIGDTGDTASTLAVNTASNTFDQGAAFDAGTAATTIRVGLDATGGTANSIFATGGSLTVGSSNTGPGGSDATFRTPDTGGAGVTGNVSIFAGVNANSGTTGGTITAHGSDFTAGSDAVNGAGAATFRAGDDAGTGALVNGADATFRGGIATNGGNAFFAGGGAFSGNDGDGGDASLLGGAGDGTGDGGPANVTGGAAGATGAGGDVAVTGGLGGSTSGAAGDVNIAGGTPTDGNGGIVTIAGSAGVGTNRAGGLVTVDGGDATGTASAGGIVITAGQSVTGSAGGIVVAAGAGGSTSGAGGNTQVTAGAGTAGNSAGGSTVVSGGAGQGTAAGGTASLIGGDGGATGDGATAFVTGGDGGSTSGAAGDVNVAGGTPTDGNGGIVTIAGSAGVGTNRAGGLVTVDGGDATGTASAGGIVLTGGQSVTGSAGGIAVTGGAGGSTSGAGGNVAVSGGGATDGNGGAVAITGANGTGTNRDGGDVTVDAGNNTGTGTAGTITLTAGDNPTAAGSNGRIQLVNGAPGAGGTVLPIAISTAASANVTGDDAIALMTNQGSGTGGGLGIRFFVADTATSPDTVVTAPPGSLYAKANAGVPGEMWLNVTTGTSSGSDWSQVTTTSTAVTRKFFQDTMANTISPGSTITASDVTGASLPTRPTAGFTWELDAQVFLNGVLLMNTTTGSTNEVDASTANTTDILVESTGPAFTSGDVITIIYWTNSTS